MQNQSELEFRTAIGPSLVKVPWKVCLARQADATSRWRSHARIASSIATRVGNGTAYINVFYNGTVVFRDIFVAVDGDRCYLPLPRNLEDLRVAPEYARLTALLSTLSLGCPSSDFCAYWRRAGLQLGDLQWPHG